MTHPVRGHCPHLGLRSDRKTVFGFPSEEHRCFAGPTRRPSTRARLSSAEAAGRRPVDLAHQEAFCFSGNYPSCPWFIQTPTTPTPGVAAGPEPAEAAAVEFPAGDEGSMARLAEIPALRALADRLGEWTQEISLLEIGAWTAFGAFAVLFLYFFLVQPLGAPPPRPMPIAAIQPTPSPTATPSPAPTPSAVPTPSGQVAPRPVVQPTVAPGQTA